MIYTVTFNPSLDYVVQLDELKPGQVKRVRGVAYSVGVSVSNNARMTESARGVLNPLAPDTYVFSQSYAPFFNSRNELYDITP